MNAEVTANETIIFLENTYGLIEAKEMELKELNAQILKANQEIKAIRAYRDAAEEDRKNLLEEMKSLAIDLENISRRHKLDEQTTQD